MSEGGSQPRPGIMGPARLYEQSFSDIAQGIGSLFAEDDTGKICNLLRIISVKVEPGKVD